MFECKNGRCVPDSSKCNGRNDCGDFSDESNCEQPKPFFSEVCEPNTFRCNDGQCLDYSQVCNDQSDCDNDEGPICKTACAETPCDQICRPTPKGAVCDCKSGYKLKSVGDHTCVDIDECQQNPCAQICKNKPGSFKCDCNLGYMLSSDLVTCKALGGVQKIFHVIFNEIRVWSVHDLNTIYESEEKINDFAVDIRRDKLILSIGNSLVTRNMTTKEMNVMEGVSTPMKIFYDWITQNIYIVAKEKFQDAIYICSMERNTCVLIRKFSHLEHIKDTGEIDPVNRWLFLVKSEGNWNWKSSKDAKNEIIKMRLDGSEVISVVEDKGILSATVDVETKQIYYASESSQSLMSVNYDGGNKRTYAHQSKFLRKPIGISIFENFAYINDQPNSQIVKCKLYGDNDCEPMSLKTANSLRAIVVHPVMQVEGENVCEGHRCEDVCVAADTGIKCLCGNGTEIARMCEQTVNFYK